MNRYVFVIIVLALIVSGCSLAPKLTKEGAQIKNVEKYTLNKCKELKVVEGYGAWEYGPLKAADVDIRNKVAAAGGNAMHVIQKTAAQRKGQGAIVAYVLRCN